MFIPSTSNRCGGHMSKKHKPNKGKAAPISLPTGVVSRFVNGAREGTPERETLTRLRREWNDLSHKGAIAKATAVFCGQKSGCLMLTFCAHGRYSDNYIIGTPYRPVPLEKLEITELSILGASADFSRGGSFF